MEDIYIVTDIETDGPCPGLNSMLSIGSVAVDPSRGIGDEAIVGSFSQNLDTAPGAKPNKDTMKWWEDYDQAWMACRRDTRPPEVVMRCYAEWLESLNARVVFVGMPVSFDFTFVHYYLHRFVGRSPFNLNAVDIESYAMAVLGAGYTETVARGWPEHWFDRTKVHTHVALDDATEQAVTFLRIMNERRSKVWGAPVGESAACPVCARPGGVLIDGAHTYGGACGRRKFQ